MRTRATVFRLIAAAIMLTAAWGLQLMLAVVMLRAADPTVVLEWAKYSGAYCLAALVLVGVPVVMLDPSSYMENRRRAVVLAGIAGATIALIPPAGALFFLTVPLGFLSGAASMWAYHAILSEYPDRFGVAKPDQLERGP